MTGFILPNGEILPKNDALVRYCCWYSNLDVKYRHDKLILTEKYRPEKYPTYYNYDAIDVGKTNEIPYDYDKSNEEIIDYIKNVLIKNNLKYELDIEIDKK